MKQLVVVGAQAKSMSVPPPGGGPPAAIIIGVSLRQPLTHAADATTIAGRMD